MNKDTKPSWFVMLVKPNHGHQHETKYDIFTNAEFCTSVKELANINSFHTFSNLLHRQCMYIFWGRCQYESVLSSWPSGAEQYKISIYDQLELNWNVFARYVWRARKLV